MKTVLLFDHDDAIDGLSGSNGRVFGGAEAKIIRFVSIVREMDDFRIVFETRRDPKKLPKVDGVEFIPRLDIEVGRPLLDYLDHVKTPPRLLLGKIARPLQRLRYPWAKWWYARKINNLLGVGRDDPRPIRFETIAKNSSVEAFMRAQAASHRFLWSVSSDADLSGMLISTYRRDQYFEMIEGADAIMAQKVSQQDALAERGVSSTLIPNALDVDVVQGEPARDHVLWVGRAAVIKQPWIVFEVARRLPSVRFVMVAPDSTPWLLQALTAQVEAFDNVTLIPGLQLREVPQMMRNAAMLIGTSWFEGFSNVYLEAAAQETPVVSLNVEVAVSPDEAGCGYHAEGDFEAFVSRIEEWMNDAEAREEAGRVARDYVRRVHSTEAVTPAFQRFLREVASR